MEGRKDDSFKIRTDLIPPVAIFGYADVLGRGARKYGDRNWEAGISYSRIFGALQRHAWDWWGGEELDPDEGQHHLSSVLWCAGTLLHYSFTGTSIDDRPVSVDRPVLGGCAESLPQTSRGYIEWLHRVSSNKGK